MSQADLEIVDTAINGEREFLNNVSTEIWKMPELKYKEVHAHATLTCALRKHGFHVEKHYFLPTAFRGEYDSGTPGPSVVILLEYDALPDIGHACGHNLIAEAGLGAALAVKAAMTADRNIPGKLIVLGTPAEEGGGGKIRLLELGAFDGADVALMVHPGSFSIPAPVLMHTLKYTVDFKGKEAHAGLCPWNGLNAMDAAVSCYMNLSLLRQQIKPTDRIHVLILKGGLADNVISSSSSMVVKLRTQTAAQMQRFRTRVEACMTSAAAATGCEVDFQADEGDSYQNLISNAVLIDLYQKYASQIGMDTRCDIDPRFPVGSSDMGNVSHQVPSIHPIYPIKAKNANHTVEFAEASGDPAAQEPTLQVAKVLALIALRVMRSNETLLEIKQQFEKDLDEEKLNS